MTHLDIRTISYRDVLGREDLVEAHYEELATDKVLMQLAPNEPLYAQLEGAGALFALGLFDDGEMVGYSVNFLNPGFHYRHLMFCQNDVLFLAKAYRSGGNGKALIEATEAEARARGAGVFLWHAKPNTALDALMKGLGNRVQDVVYSKGL